MAINIGTNTDGDVTYQNPPVNRVLFPNIKEGASTEEIQEAVNAWLDEHPEATTTVEDGSILPVKLDSSNSASDGYVLSYNATAGKFEWYDVGGELDEINSDITDLKQEFNQLDPVIENQEPVISTENTYDSSMMVDGYWIGADGVIHALSGGYGYAKIPVESGETYVLSYGNVKPNYWSGGAGGYLVYDANDELVELIKVEDLTDSTADVGYSSRYITIPDGGAYLLITLSFGSGWDDTQTFVLYKISLVGGVLTELYGASVEPYSLKWKGKKWVAFGDSLTEVNTRASMHYHDYIKEATGITVVNMGASGTGYKRSENDGKAFYMRISNVPTDADLVTIFGSGNDLNYTAMGFNTFAEALGQVTDTTTDTICGCINKTIENLYAVLPTVQLALVTPCPWQSYNPANVGNNMDLYSEAIVEICKLHGIVCLDLYHCSELRPWEASFRQLCYSNDDGGGTHPDNNGHKILAPRFSALLESIII